MINLIDESNLQHLARLLRKRNANEVAITRVIGRAALLGHIGEYIASQIFYVDLGQSAVQPGIDGHFKSGPLAGQSVNIKMYSKREGKLDVYPEYLPDYYLVLTGPKYVARNSKGTARPWGINEVFLFEAKPLIERLRQRDVKLGIGTSVREEEWMAARIYPHTPDSPLVLTSTQRDSIRHFELSSR